MKEANKTQATVLNLLFNSLKFEEWYIQGRFIGFKLKNDLGKEVRYCLDPIHWNTNRPPALDWQTTFPTPESHLRQMIHSHFGAIQRLIVKNNWIYPSYSVEHPKGTLLSYSVTGINSHTVICPEKLGDENAISCNQLLELCKREFVKKMIRKVDSYLEAKLGEKIYLKLKKTPRDQRAQFYVRNSHNYID